MPASFRRYAALLMTLLVSIGVLAVLAQPTPALGQAEEQAGDGRSDDPVIRALRPLVEVLRYLDRFYYKDVSLPDLVRGAIDGALRALGDPHSVFYPPSEVEDLQLEVEGTYTGIGVSITIEGDYVIVQTPFPDSPAERAGLQPGDRILAVDGRDVVGEPADVVARLIRGAPGTQVELTVQRGDGEPFQVTLVRERIQRQAVDARMIGEDIGYIRITQFFEGTGAQVKTAYERLVRLGVEGIVLDLRNNPGGLLNEAVEVARVFVPRGAIVHVVDYEGKRRTYSARPHPPGPPVAVLVNGGSASASEIVAAAIQQNGAGVLVGTRTFGKGTVQSIVELDDGSTLKFTTAEYLTPRGEAIPAEGLEPDILVAPGAPSPGEAPEPEFAPLSGRYRLTRGDRGLEVEGLQQRLNYIGYDAGPVDGVFGARTEAALRAFQRDQGLPTTGHLDAATHERLGRAVMARWQGDAAEPTVGVGRRGGDPVLVRAVEYLRSGNRAATGTEGP